MKKRYIGFREYLGPLLTESTRDAVEATIVTAMIMFFLIVFRGIVKDWITLIQILARVFFSVLFTSLGIRNAKNLNKFLAQIAIYAIAGIYCLTAAANVIIDIIS